MPLKTEPSSRVVQKSVSFMKEGLNIKSQTALHYLCGMYVIDVKVVGMLLYGMTSYLIIITYHEVVD
jgi:hypothetical protein